LILRRYDAGYPVLLFPPSSLKLFLSIIELLIIVFI